MQNNSRIQRQKNLRRIIFWQERVIVNRMLQLRKRFNQRQQKLPQHIVDIIVAVHSQRVNKIEIILYIIDNFFDDIVRIFAADLFRRQNLL